MLRFDDQFPLHRKVNGLTDAGFRLHVEAIFWCARNLTDGFIAQIDLASVSRFRRPEGYVAECVLRGAWHRITDGIIDDGCPECDKRYGGTLAGDGWLIHGYLDWQLPRSKVLQKRMARQKAGRAGGIKSGQVRASRKNPDLLPDDTPTKPQAIQGREAPAKQNRTVGASSAVEPPIPSPSKEGIGDARPASPGAASVPADAPPPAPRPTGGTPPPPGLLDEARAAAAAASRKFRSGGPGAPPRRHPSITGGAFSQLMPQPDPPAGPAPVFHPPDYESADALIETITDPDQGDA